VVLRLLVGSQWGWPDSTILGLRLLRVELALVAGVALAASGVGLQSLLRNPLAEPFILGLSSGAAVGVIVQLFMRRILELNVGPSQYGAMIGAMATMTIVYLAGRKRGVIDPLGLLLVGVILSTINASIIMFLSYFTMGEAGLREDLFRWMMGYLNENVGLATLRWVGVVTAVGVGLLFWLGRQMDAASFSDSEAHSMGVNLKLLRSLLFATSSILAAGAVVLAGPLAFVGLICPHIARLLLGPGHRSLVIGSAMLGGVLVIGADVTAVALDRGQGLMPIGIFIAMLGGPVFLWMLRSTMGRGLS
jgi:iron complex transport system permease protein